MKTNKEKTNKNKPETIPLISFFTGGGFLDMGFEQAGFNVIWTNENNPVFADMYSHGMSNWRSSIGKHAPKAFISNTKSIEIVSATEILKQAFKSKKPRFFGIIGGPPCPDFSTGGKNKGGIGENGRLSKTYVLRICKMNPSFFVFENVPGLYKTKVHRAFLANLERRLERSGYYLDLKILNALDLGVPQDRERLIMIGIQKKYVSKCLGQRVEETKRGWFPWPMIRKYYNAKTRFNWPDTVDNEARAILPKGVPEELTVYSIFNPNKKCPSRIQNGKDVFKVYSKKFLSIKEGDTKRKSFKKLHRYRFSPTACYGHNEVHLHPWEKRRLSVREAMRIQGIPDTYTLPEEAPLTAKFTIVSNGVPVPLAREVAKKIRTFFKKGNLI
jgi:DNA (cytosine-5)-methyltransferase 1